MPKKLKGRVAGLYCARPLSKSQFCFINRQWCRLFWTQLYVFEFKSTTVNTLTKGCLSGSLPGVRSCAFEDMSTTPCENHVKHCKSAGESGQCVYKGICCNPKGTQLKGLIRLAMTESQELQETAHVKSYIVDTSPKCTEYLLPKDGCSSFFIKCCLNLV